MSRKDSQTVELWRSALREGDPALGAPDLDPQEVARMRRAVLAAAEGGARKPRLLPGLTPAWGGALAAAVALLLALAIVWLPNREEPQPERIAELPPMASPAPRPAPAPLPVEEAAPAPAAPASPVAPGVPAPLPVPASAAPEEEAEMALAEAPAIEPAEEEIAELDWSGFPAEPAVAAVEDLPRQMQLTTPGGTRVIWVLGPQDDATQEAHSTGPEETTE